MGLTPATEAPVATEAPATEVNSYVLVNQMASRLEAEAKASGDIGREWQAKLIGALFRKATEEAGKPIGEQKLDNISVEGLFDAHTIATLVARMQ